MSAMVALSITSLFSGDSFAVDMAVCCSGRLVLIRRRFRSLVEIARGAAPMPCVRQASFVCAAPIASIAAYAVVCWSVALLIFSSYS